MSNRRCQGTATSPVNGSIKIGTAFGIPIRLHWTFLLLLYVVAIVAQGPPLVVALWIVGLFGSVLLHELGHSLVAKSFGIRVIDITFWPLGGMARMSEIPEVPRVEGLVAIAGPAVNFVLAAFGIGGLILGGLLSSEPLAEASVVFTGVNLVMGTFNLIPAFPMDGGRILRAWCGRSTDWVSATEQAVAVGRVFAAIMFFGALIAPLLGGPGLCAMPLIAVFVWIAGGRELLAVRMRHGMSPFGGVRVASPSGRAPYAEGQTRIEPPPTDPEPGSAKARRPAGWGVRPPSGGFSEQTVRELERFHGRLRPPRPEEE